MRYAIKGTLSKQYQHRSTDRWGMSRTRWLKTPDWRFDENGKAKGYPDLWDEIVASRRHGRGDAIAVCLQHGMEQEISDDLIPGYA